MTRKRYSKKLLKIIVLIVLAYLAPSQAIAGVSFDSESAQIISQYLSPDGELLLQVTKLDYDTACLLEYILPKIRLAHPETIDELYRVILQNSPGNVLPVRLDGNKVVIQAKGFSIEFYSAGTSGVEGYALKSAPFIVRFNPCPSTGMSLSGNSVEDNRLKDKSEEASEKQSHKFAGIPAFIDNERQLADIVINRSRNIPLSRLDLLLFERILSEMASENCYFSFPERLGDLIYEKALNLLKVLDESERDDTYDAKAKWLVEQASKVEEFRFTQIEPLDLREILNFFRDLSGRAGFIKFAPGRAKDLMMFLTAPDQHIVAAMLGDGNVYILEQVYSTIINSQFPSTVKVRLLTALIVHELVDRYLYTQRRYPRLVADYCAEVVERYILGELEKPLTLKDVQEQFPAGVIEAEKGSGETLDFSDLSDIFDERPADSPEEETGEDWMAGIDVSVFMDSAEVTVDKEHDRMVKDSSTLDALKLPSLLDKVINEYFAQKMFTIKPDEVTARLGEPNFQEKAVDIPVPEWDKGESTADIEAEVHLEYFIKAIVDAVYETVSSNTTLEFDKNKFYEAVMSILNKIKAEDPKAVVKLYQYLRSISRRKIKLMFHGCDEVKRCLFTFNRADAEIGINIPALLAVGSSEVIGIVMAVGIFGHSLFGYGADISEVLKEAAKSENDSPQDVLLKRDIENTIYLLEELKYNPRLFTAVLRDIGFQDEGFIRGVESHFLMIRKRFQAEVRSQFVNPRGEVISVNDVLTDIKEDGSFSMSGGFSRLCETLNLPPHEAEKVLKLAFSERIRRYGRDINLEMAKTKHFTFCISSAFLSLFGNHIGTDSISTINHYALNEITKEYRLIAFAVGLSHEILGHEAGIDNEYLLTQQDMEITDFIIRYMNLSLTDYIQELSEVITDNSPYLRELVKLSVFSKIMDSELFRSPFGNQKRFLNGLRVIDILTGQWSTNTFSARDVIESIIDYYALSCFRLFRDIRKVDGMDRSLASALKDRIAHNFGIVMSEAEDRILTDFLTDELRDEDNVLSEKAVRDISRKSANYSLAGRMKLAPDSGWDNEEGIESFAGYLKNKLNEELMNLFRNIKFSKDEPGFLYFDIDKIIYENEAVSKESVGILKMIASSGRANGSYTVVLVNNNPARQIEDFPQLRELAGQCVLADAYRYPGVNQSEIGKVLFEYAREKAAVELGAAGISPHRITAVICADNLMCYNTADIAGVILIILSPPGKELSEEDIAFLEKVFPNLRQELKDSKDLILQNEVYEVLKSIESIRKAETQIGSQV